MKFIKSQYFKNLLDKQPIDVTNLHEQVKLFCQQYRRVVVLFVNLNPGNQVRREEGCQGDQPRAALPEKRRPGKMPAAADHRDGDEAEEEHEAGVGGGENEVGGPLRSPPPQVRPQRQPRFQVLDLVEAEVRQL